MEIRGQQLFNVLLLGSAMLAAAGGQTRPVRLSSLVAGEFASALPQATTSSAVYLSMLNRFRYRIGDPLPPQQVMSITADTLNETVNLTAASTPLPWLEVTPGRATVPAQATVRANPTGLSPGTHTGTITVSGTAYDTVTKTVFLDVLPAVPMIVAPLETVRFDYTVGGPAPPSRTVRVQSSSDQLEISTSAVSTGNWLRVSQARSTTPTDIVVAVAPQQLAPQTYTGQVTIFATGASNSPVSFQVVLAVSSNSNVSLERVTNGASFLPEISPGSWITIFGRNLTTIPEGRIWRAEEIVNGALPVSLEGISVRINNRPAYVYYVSSTQLNVQAPDDSSEGPVTVEVFTPGGTASTTAALRQIAPGLFTGSAAPGQRTLAAAVHTDGVYVGRAGIPNLRAVRPGDRILLYGTGFGPTAPTREAGRVIGAAPLAAPFSVRIGGVPAAAEFGGLSAAGLYQFNVIVPEVADGDQPVVIETMGRQTQPEVYLPVQR